MPRSKNYHPNRNLSLKISGYTNTLTEASNLIDRLYKRGEVQKEQQNRKALDFFQPNKGRFQVNYLSK